MSAATTSECALAEQETLRLNALGTFQIAGTAPEKRFDAIVQLAARLFRTPIAYVSLIDQHHQWIKAQVGLDQVGLDQVGLERAGGDPAPTARGASFCTHTIRFDDPLVIPDTWGAGWGGHAPANRDAAPAVRSASSSSRGPAAAFRDQASERCPPIPAFETTTR